MQVRKVYLGKGSWAHSAYHGRLGRAHSLLERPSTLPENQASMYLYSCLDCSICGDERWNGIQTAGLAETQEDCRGESG
jgi:hypothetical protein